MTDNTTLTPATATATPTQADLDRARERAADALSDAHAAVTEWSALVRDGAVDRVGSVHTDAVMHDPAYDRALDVFSPVNRAVAAFRDVAEQITAGGLR
ncbi:hypothetical protein [Prauserella alba]|uniref:Uncharacterized protein n=1 Tax=Prauserella alba TaxID=176898 RepID=A0ABP4G2N3_9PSEU|nr:hypothetical protein [Prauserella alba]MCP2180022.1 hypothetical protein [Prauserella alba]